MDGWWKSGWKERVEGNERAWKGGSDKIELEKMIEIKML